MPQLAVQGTDRSVVHAAPSDGSEERVAPNGRIAVLVDGKWAGYLYEESGGTCGRGSKTVVLFEVEHVGAGLKISRAFDCPSKHKKALGKQIHYDKTISFVDGRTTSGERCQLFTL